MMYVIDSDKRIIYRNAAFKAAYPHINLGEYCYKVLGYKTSVCKVCPLLRKEKENIYYNEVAGEWIKSYASEIEWQDKKGCYVILFKAWKSGKEDGLSAVIHTDSLAGLALERESNKLKEETRRREELISELSDDYSNVFYVDYAADTFEVLRSGGNIPDDIKELVLSYNVFSDCMGLYVERYIYKPDKAAARKVADLSYLSKKLKEKRSFVYNYRVVRDKLIVYHQMKCVHIGNANQTTNMIIGFRDADDEIHKDMEQKQALADALELAKKANAAKSSFLFNMSHDIRTPMNAVLGFTRIAREHINDREMVLDSLIKVEHAGEHMLRLINDILDMSKIENSKLELESAPCNLKAAITETAEFFRREMEDKNLSFSVVFENIEDEYVMCDYMRIRQIEINLLSNALKYTKSGGTVIYRIIQHGKESNGYADYELIVQDTGIGIDKAAQKRIFEAFERERSATESGVEGTGLGLAITKRLVELLGGSIELESERGKGSEFRVRLRLKTTESVKLSRSTGEKHKLSFKGKRVLVAEDNELNREIVEIILTEHGFIVETAEDGAKAVEMVAGSKSGYYDLVLMDIQMPYMDGYQATREIRQLSNRELANVPIIAMTANAFAEDRLKALECGMNDHIAKPLDIDKLEQVLKRI
jgi:signal transduction histidine kinase/ActR/RegA family two-component response regulator